jgi:hypothetical protein
LGPWGFRCDTNPVCRAHAEGAAASFLADFAIANVGHLGWICRCVMF